MFVINYNVNLYPYIKLILQYVDECWYFEDEC